ncbi:hypothetical protein [Actinomadura harenae]|uniref:Uncharacterized protein n=1 Tax=Actinomadura harenae TaxID=2483351 RepID=A0A3M2MCV1_9ACTN|nr:hypothetical protein [Actinomadura harenae]RMI47362.1 hypothetical protein EBO15_02250 [Actinomadura harenae]
MAKVTSRIIADRLVELGMVTRARADEALAKIATYSPDHDAEIAPEDVVDFLYEFGVTVVVHGDDVTNLEDSYRGILESAAACSGEVTVTNVQLVEEDDEEILKFRLNGEPTSWIVDHLMDHYLDRLTVWESIDVLGPGGDDPRVFHTIIDDGHTADIYVLATPAQAAALRADFGLALEP